MKKTHMLLVGVLSLGIMVSGAAVAKASVTQPDRPAWVTPDGRADLSKMPDNAKIPYTCWSGKTVTLEGKTIKQKEKNNAMPGSAEHELGMAKMKELRQVPGAVTTDSRGGEVIDIDESNPQIQKIMKKYELKENPQCQ